MANRIPIQALKDLAKKFGLTHVVLLAHQADGNLDHVVTYGVTVEQADEAASFGNHMKEVLGWPASLCKAQPSRVKKLQERLEKAEKACRTLMQFEWHIDGDDTNDDTLYWRAVREAREAVGDFTQPD